MADSITTEFEEHTNAGYRGRTLRNASADVTFAFAADFSTAGERLTKRSVLEQRRVYCPIAYRGQPATENAIQAAVAALNRVGKPEVALNIAGNGLHTLKRFGDQAAVDAYAHDFLRRVLAAPELATAITLVRSGGQTGFDEAGVKAAQQLGLRSLVLAPKGWIFRTADGQDISNEQEFKSRFRNPVQLEPEPEVVPMSIDAFRKSRIKTDDIGKMLGPKNMHSAMVQGIRGYVYEHGLYIEAAKNDFVLTIANDITRDTSMTALEQRLYRWAVDEGYEFTGAPYVPEPHASEKSPRTASSYIYDADEALKAIRARLDGVWDDTQLVKLGSLMPIAMEDIRRIVASTSDAHIPTPMERMLAEALRSMVDSGGYYDDGDFYIEATEAERAGDDIEVVRNAHTAVRVYDEALGRYGKDKLHPVIPDFTAKVYTHDEVLQRYRELLKANPGKGLLIDGTMVAVADPGSERLYYGEHLGGPDVMDVRHLLVLAPHRGNLVSSDNTIREIDHPTFVDLPEGFDQSLRDALAVRASSATPNEPARMTLTQFEERFKPVNIESGVNEVTYLHPTFDNEVRYAPTDKVWTLVNTDGVERLCPGTLRVNAEAYIVCEVPWTDFHLEVEYAPGGGVDLRRAVSQEM